MNTLKIIVWIVVVAIVVWVGYVLINKKSAVPAAEQGPAMVKTVEILGESVQAPASNNIASPAPAPAVIPPRAPAPAVTPPSAPAPKAPSNY